MNLVELRGQSVFLIEEFLSPEECGEMIRLAETIGFVEAPINTRSGPQMRKDIRNNTRILHEDPNLGQQLFERARPYLVQSWFFRKPIGFNERFRFYKYQPGQRFAPHFDGYFDRGNGQRSEFTFLIYLNEAFQGGSTRFFEPELIDVQPRTGTALVFHHPQLHEGAVIESGTKYVLRTDVMYGSDA